jgi:hypothetical protein
MPARKKAAKKARKRPRTAKATPKSRLSIPAQLARIERAVNRTLEVVEFLEGEIIKARDAQDMANEKIEATPYSESM